MTSSMGGPGSRYGSSMSSTTSGWLVCAAMLLLVAGTFNIMHGLVALNQSEYLVNELLFSNLDTWGWVFLGFGALQVLSGGFAWTGSSWAVLTGSFLAMIAMVLWFLMIFAAPFAALAGIAINVMILYGLNVGNELETT